MTHFPIQNIESRRGNFCSNYSFLNLYSYVAKILFLLSRERSKILRLDTTGYDHLKVTFNGSLTLKKVLLVWIRIHHNFTCHPSFPN